MAIPNRNDPCPCESTKLSKECCKKMGKWLRRPSFVLETNPINQSQQVAGCYLSTCNSCMGSISKEHYLSKNILNIIGETFEVGGIPKLAEKNLSCSALVSKILCQKHNSDLSILDSEAGRFFRFLHNMYQNPNESKFSIFSGDDLELWLVKTLIGFIKVYFPIDVDDESMNFLTDLLKKQTSFPHPCGLYVVCEEQSYLSNSVRILPKIDIGTGKLQRVNFYIYRIRFLLVFDSSELEDNPVFKPSNTKMAFK